MLRRYTYPAFNEWAKQQPAAAAARLEAGIKYLLEHARGAVLPDVRLRIQESAHFPDLAEVRVDDTFDGARRSYRVLACFVEEDLSLLVCLGGDKHGFEAKFGRSWYSEFVPVADRIVDDFIKIKGGTS